MTTSLNVTDKLPAGIVEVYGRLHGIAVKLDESTLARLAIDTHTQDMKRQRH